MSRRGVKHAFWSPATGFGLGVYVKEYLGVAQLNWKTFSGQVFDIYQGITLYHTPGHTAGRIVMELEMENAGSVIITGMQFT